EPADLGLGPEDQGVEQDQERRVAFRVGLGLAARVRLELLDGGTPLPLEERGDVDVARRDREEHLDRQLVAGRGLDHDRVVEPLAELGAARRCDSVLPPVLFGGRVPVDGLDEPVPLQPLDGRVDLPDVERPVATGSPLEGSLELVAVAGSLVEEREQSVPDRHAGQSTYSVCTVNSDRRNGDLAAPTAPTSGPGSGCTRRAIAPSGSGPCGPPRAVRRTSPASSPRSS